MASVEVDQEVLVAIKLDVNLAFLRSLARRFARLEFLHVTFVRVHAIIAVRLWFAVGFRGPIFPEGAMVHFGGCLNLIGRRKDFEIDAINSDKIPNGVWALPGRVVYKYALPGPRWSPVTSAAF